MRVARIRHDGQKRVAILRDAELLLLDTGTDPLDVLELAPDERDALVEETARSGTRIPASDADFLPALEPASIRDFVCFTQHIEGMMHSVGDGDLPDSRLLEPTFYFGNPHAVIGAHDDVEIPPDCVQFDYELEVGAIIGRPGRDIAPEQARDHILAYTMFNDWTARDIAQQARRDGRHATKAKDSAITLGPWLVSSDELEPYRFGDDLDLAMTVWLNGREMGSDRLSSMGWSFDEIVSFASRGAWIGRGDVLASGTCGGGCLAELWGRAGRVEPPPLRTGDVVRMTVEGLGTIENRIVAGAGVPPAIVPVRRMRTSP